MSSPSPRLWIAGIPLDFDFQAACNAIPGAQNFVLHKDRSGLHYALLDMASEKDRDALLRSAGRIFPDFTVRKARPPMMRQKKDMPHYVSYIQPGLWASYHQQQLEALLG